MATAEPVLWLIPYTVKNPYDLRPVSTCWIILMAILQDTFTMLPSPVVLKYLCRAYRRVLCTSLGRFGTIASGLTAISMSSWRQIFIVLVAYNYNSIVIIRAPSSFQSAEAIRAAIPTARLLRMVLAAAAVV